MSWPHDRFGHIPLPADTKVQEYGQGAGPEVPAHIADDTDSARRLARGVRTPRHLVKRDVIADGHQGANAAAEVADGDVDEHLPAHGAFAPDGDVG